MNLIRELTNALTHLEQQLRMRQLADEHKKRVTTQVRSQMWQPYASMDYAQYGGTVDRPKHIYKFIAQLPKDYCLIPGNCTIKLVETKNLLELIIFNFGFGLIYCKCTGRQVIKWI